MRAATEEDCIDYVEKLDEDDMPSEMVVCASEVMDGGRFSWRWIVYSSLRVLELLKEQL